MAHLLVVRGTVGAGKSSLATPIRQSRPTVQVVEIDDIKQRKYGTTACSDPETDFPEAGRMAKRHLEEGRDTILVEAFVTKDHLELALRETGRRFNSPGLTVVWLECSKEIALERTTGGLSPQIVEGQYSRYTTRYKVPGEHVIGTDGRTISQAADDVLSFLSPGFGSGSPTA